MHISIFFKIISFPKTVEHHLSDVMPERNFLNQFITVNSKKLYCIF